MKQALRTQLVLDCCAVGSAEWAASEPAAAESLASYRIFGRCWTMRHAHIGLDKDLPHSLPASRSAMWSNISVPCLLAAQQQQAHYCFVLTRVITISCV